MANPIQHKASTHPVAGLVQIDPALLENIQRTPQPELACSVSPRPKLWLMRLDEINEESPSTYRSALANVYATLDADDGTSFLYLLDGGPDGVSLHFGIIESRPDSGSHEAFKNLWGALEGQLPGINLGNEENIEPLIQRLEQSRFQGVVLGVPTLQDEGQGSEDENFQGIERLVRTLVSQRGLKDPNVTRWQLAVVCQPLSRVEARKRLDAAYDLASEIAALVRTSVQASGNSSEQKGSSYSSSTADGENTNRADSRGKSEGVSDTRSHGTSKSNGSSSSSGGQNSGTSQAKNWGTNEGVTKTTGTSTTRTESDSVNLSRNSGSSLGITQEFTDKRSQHLLEHLEKILIPRLQKGVTKGLFCTAIHICADRPSTYRSLKRTLCATYQGGEATASPMEVLDLPEGSAGQALRLPLLAQPLEPRVAVFHSLGAGRAPNSLGSLLTADEVALVAGLPRQELPGLRRRKTVEFTVALPRPGESDAIDLGEVIDCGRRQPSNRVRLDKADLNKHCFITGVTGAGKTTTCLNLLVESGLPFLVIEPAKTEYRALHGRLAGEIDYYRPNGDTHRSLRLNPFALLHRKQKLKSHASFLRNAFAAIFPMEASMPYLVEQAILRAYEEKGWDLADDSCLLADDPFDPAARAWPTMSDMIRQLDVLIPEQRMGPEFTEKYRGSLVSRLTSLTHGVLGDVLDVPQSLDFTALLDRHVVIELEEVKDGEGKALMMALLLGAVSEAIRQRHSNDSSFRHLTLVEEAHRLLSRPEPGDKARAMAVDAFADLLAEVRKYGEGLIIADQIPAKLIPDVIKNTHTKIVHRLFAEDDRRAMGEAMMMDDDQRDFMPNLATGEAIVFCGGWHGPTHAAIRSDHAGTDRSPLAEADIEARAIGQLWRERKRYYPSLATLGWLGSGEDAPHRFAQFVRHTRKAFGHLLALNPHNRGQKREYLYAQRFAALQRWLHDWQTFAITAPLNIDAWGRLSGQPRPGQPLTAPLLAMLYDASPRPHAQAKPNSAWPWLIADWHLWQGPFDTLLEHLAGGVDATDFVKRMNESRELKGVLVNLGQYQSF
ncbi:ATPase-like protein [Azoarcus sp. CIB]|uniref:ATP-binding protein n=1 Tax=Aromatoleum sp. (strain CIB) TaxID=198107 RepID=UPI00067C5E29|nr:ATP-binding protein [Azoarcus sp. CIB]AKU11337.1 ATPase-like protein [Azoarcus sp. CIB]